MPESSQHFGSRPGSSLALLSAYRSRATGAPLTSTSIQCALPRAFHLEVPHSPMP